ncbi:MAG: hypothetical protein JJ902_06295 [Roseibium sp.]|nr:hypothetical protein [Roseibium sp.]
MQMTRLAAAALATLVGSTPVAAAGLSPEQIKPILEMTSDSWVAFRDWQGNQLIYFTHLESWTCGLNAVTYGVNGEPVDQVWPLQPCDPDAPNAITKDKPYLTFPAGSIATIAVQLTYKDGSRSAVTNFTYKP